MLIAAFISFIGAFLMTMYLYKGTNPTMILIARIFLHVLVVAFLLLLFAYFISAVPPIPDAKPNSPI